MAFITDLLADLPVPDESEVGNAHIHSMLTGLQKAVKRVNEELEFIKSLKVARSEIDEIERKLAVVEMNHVGLEEWQAGTNTKLSEIALKSEAEEAERKSVAERLTVVEAGAWQSSSPGKGGAYDP